MKVNFIDLKKQYEFYKKEIDASFQDILNNTRFILGKEVNELENAMHEWMQAKYTLGVSSGTDALLVGLLSYDIKPGDEIITTPFTFFATIETIVLLGGIPVYADIDPETYNIDASKIEEKITSKTKGIVPVSLYGQMPDLDPIMEVAKKHHLFVMEDAAQSMGATYKGKFSGNVTESSATSFFPAKALGAYGDGGMFFTNNENIAKRAKMIFNAGQSSRYVHDLIGINGRLDTLQAAVVLAKLPHYEMEIKHRQEAAKYYNEHLSVNKNIKIPVVREYATHIYSQYTIKIENNDRDKVQKVLLDDGIPTAVHYPEVVYKQKALLDRNFAYDVCPYAEEASSKVLSLPMHGFITKEDQNLVIEALLKHIH